MKEDKKGKINENSIIAIFEIKKDNLNQRIINSYENAKRGKSKYLDWDKNKGKENEEEIKDCKIFINDKKIDFNYYYNFQDEGSYII